ncbi:MULTISPECIES: type 1 glutamine amidotransferase domain-containing protein [Streptomyces]|uniref:Type 1 glutamine amidotransferase domain-containing protein n=2 Tax=Streptomyces TaxID=1883 RepID=A0A652KQ11_9ACTN|nr:MULTISPECIES: type 1 glutamine amidotransferase domain-containing protein [unclassified Streptomyces]WSS60353.1 type 1 glutamine amidotransferase domain-containing protein [Streptomyces sp. NBC_01177]WSS67460.1 type 1 glutamine amidotransferase domain-containing protein [Streptomyces sp. NBC_01175]WSS74378.1 type 1 glutamine amidotransferase domain-containing protein [Streptomyces sp. NBC_01174]MDX3323918.1 type 1 glutamine amidotransferase domain-containing protein [Streptomyces sp. ME02-69
MSKIVFVMTGADAWTLADGARRPTGFWADEAVIPYEAFKAAGHEITVATPGGVVPPADPTSLSAGANGGEAGAAAVRAVLDSAEFRHPSVLSDVRVEDFDAVYVPGGRGPMEDLAVDADCGRVLTEAVESGLPVGVVCHGPAALLAAVKEDGTNAYSGYRITTFSNAEEQLTGCAEISKWLLEDRLTAAGLKVEVGEPWAPFVRVDRNVVTGQNPASSGLLATELLKKLA